jgi:hypothetical protein
MQVGELLALVSKASGAIGVEVDASPEACLPPIPTKDRPLQLKNVLKSFLGGRGKPSSKGNGQLVRLHACMHA